MLVQVRFFDDKQNGHNLPKMIDLNRFSEEDIRNRLVDYGIAYDTELTVTYIADLEVKVQMNLKMAYVLTKAINELYDGDTFVVSCLLKAKWTPYEIVTNYFVFETTDEKELLKEIFKSCGEDKMINCFVNGLTSADILTEFTRRGYVLNTPKGFYLHFNWKNNKIKG